MGDRVASTKLTPASDPLNAIANAISGNDLFMVRLANNKKWHEYQAFRKKRIDGGQGANEATRAAKKEYGFLGHKGEREAYVLAIQGFGESLKEANQERNRRMTMKKRNAPFEKAFAELPEAASVETEIDWVRNHPAMARKARMSSHGNAKEVTIMIQREDLLEAPHGKCPSKCAANMLQNWVNSPDKFFSDILKEQKKGLKGNRVEDEGGGDERNIAADIDDILNAARGV